MEKLYSKELKSWTFNNVFISSVFISITIVILLFSSNTANAQMECRSMIGAHLTPLGKNIPISWAVEGTFAPGVMTSPFDTLGNTTINGGMLLAALEFRVSKNSSFYIEGGYKNWKNSEFVDDEGKKSQHLGVRQLFFGTSSKNTKFKIGLHEMRMGEFFLVDERVLGVSLDQNIGSFFINLRGGTVSQSFARMGKFCANKHLYGIVNPDYTENIGKKIGETNLAGLVINWDPHNTGSGISTSSGDEFLDGGSDEFHENHDFNEFNDTDEFSQEEDEFSLADEFGDEPKGKSKIQVKNVALILYDEFGTSAYIPDNKFYIGSLIDVKMPLGIMLQTGAVYQNMNLNNTLVYIVKIGKSHTWNNASNTKFGAAYIGKNNIDDNALFQPLFSNLFLGEIMRMDAVDFPLWQASLKHRFPGKMKFHLALKVVAQLDDPKTNEQDIEAGMLTFKNHLKVTLIGSRVQTQNLPNEFYTARVELRIAF